MKPRLTALVLLAALSVVAQDQPEQSHIVRVTRPERTTLAETIIQTGSMESPAVVDLFPKISGRLVSTALADGSDVTEGTPVTNGMIIARIDPRDYKANLLVAEASRDAARATLDDARKEFKRTQALLEEGSTTEQESDRAQATLLRAEATLQEAEARLMLARINLEETDIRAPFDGRISRKHAHPGAMLSPATPLYTIQRMDPLRVFFDLPTTVYDKIEPGVTQVAITVDAYPDETVVRTLCNVHPAANENTRTVRVELHLENPDSRYLPGMYARGEIALNARENVLVIPRQCLIKVIDHYIVYTVVDSRAVATDVTLGIRQNERYEVLDGLTDDDVVISVGHHRLSDGVPVRIESDN